MNTPFDDSETKNLLTYPLDYYLLRLPTSFTRSPSFQPGSYGIKVFSTPQPKEWKMYNHSCDQMDRKEGQDVPVFLTFDELSTEGVGEKANLELLDSTNGQYDLKKGFEIYQAKYEELRENAPDLPKWTESQVRETD